ncbi:MAG: hypothetical protein ABJN84_11640 [Flavobacteriaceae bacterium]
MSKEEKTKKLVHDELKTVNWNDVDQYPLFDNCDENATKKAQRDCFQHEILNHFSQALDSLQFEVTTDLNDTLYVDFLVDEHGFITVLNIEENPNILKEIEEFNAEITSRLLDLTVAPALKRGTPVSLRFRLPLVVNTN